MMPSHGTTNGEDAATHAAERIESWWQFRPLQLAALSGFVLGGAFALAQAGWIPEGLAISLYVTAAVIGAWHWGREALESLPRLQINIDVLMLVAMVGSAVFGLWEEAAFLAFLYATAEGIEELTYDRTRHAIRSLLDLAPKQARVLRNGEERMIPAVDLKPGDRFLVRPGENLATDGVVRDGATTLDESPVTGESMPVEKAAGARVFAGTVNLTGAIEVEATHAFEDNTLSKIIHLVEEAQEVRTNAQRFIDRFGAVYSPALLGGAAVVLLIPWLLGGDFTTWAERAVTLTVAGAPCALVMSTPVAVAAGIGSAGKRGILIKGGVHLENLGLIRVLAFDKTGTLTRGDPVVTDIVPLNRATPADVLQLAASIEANSEHPLARAIVRRATRDGLVSAPASGFLALTGAGAQAEVDGVRAYVGSPALFAERGLLQDGEVPAAVADLQAEGKTVILVGRGHRLAGALALRDEPRPGAREAVASLHDAGIAHVVMLTGDNPQTARAIATSLGIDDVKAELHPEQKTAAIRELEASLGPAAMVGDGINDAPALASATVGLAMGTAGTDAAIEAADVALMGDDLNSVVLAIGLGRKVQRISRQNIAFSLLLLAVLVPSAIAGFLTVAIAVTAHEVAEIIAVGNGLRARV